MQCGEKFVLHGSVYSSVELLEDRRLLSTVLGNTGTLTIDETIGDNDIVIDRAGSNLNVTVNTQLVFSTPVTNVTKIVVTTGDGADSIRVGTSSRNLNIPMRVDAGAGDDTIVSAAGNDTLVGGMGSDSMAGGAGDDIFWGGREGTLSSIDNSPDNVLGEAGFDRMMDFQDDNFSIGRTVSATISGFDIFDAGAQLPAPTPSTTSVVSAGAILDDSSFIGLTPDMVRQLYKLGSVGSGVALGDGQTIYLITAFATPKLANDLLVFSKAYGLPFSSSQLQIVNASGSPGVDEAWANVTAAEVEWMHAIAPKAKIVVVQAESDLGSDISLATRKAVSLSEKNGGGIVYFGFTAGMGTLDSGVADVVHAASRTTFVAPTGEAGVTTGFPVVDSFVVSVGSSSLTVNADGTRSDETAYTNNQSGLVVTVDQDGNQTPYPPPSWQRELGFTTNRVVPDVVYNGDPTTPYSFYSSTAILNGSTFLTGWKAAGGSAMAGAQWAAIFALANQKRAKAGLDKLGLSANPTLYAIYQAKTFGAFIDITSGVAGVDPSDPTSTGTPADIGFDVATGLGAPNIGKLLTAMASVQPFFLSGSFKWSGTYYRSPYASALATGQRDVLIGQPRGGTGSVSGGSRILLSFTAVPNKFAPSTVALLDTITVNSAGLYRTSDGHVYGYGTATINDEDALTPTSETFTIRFEGSITRVDAKHEKLSLKFFAVDPATNKAVPKSPFARQLAVENGTEAYDGTWFGGQLSTTVLSLAAKVKLPADTAPISGIDPDIYEGSSPFTRDNTSSHASLISSEGLPQQHTMHTAADVDWVTFTLTERSKVVIETNGVSGGDTILTLYNAKLKKIASNDDAGIGAYSRITTTLGAGQYYVKISQYAKFNRGIRDYNIVVRAGNPLPPSPFGLVNSVLTVNGTDAENQISLSRGVSDIIIDIDGARFYVPNSSVRSIRVFGQGGDDRIDTTGLGRAASLFGGDGNDTILAGTGNDVIYGGFGDDSIEAGAGNDTVYGEDNTDILSDDPSVSYNDTIFGEDGDDDLFGNAGDDTINGGAGSDSLDGGDGDDDLTAGSGSVIGSTTVGSFLSGGAGHDFFHAENGVMDTLFADTGEDDVEFDDTVLVADVFGPLV